MHLNIKQFLAIPFILITLLSTGQNDFQAIIKDSLTNQSLLGATISLKGTSNGVSVDSLGRATLNDIPNGEQVIRVSFIGYHPKDKKIIFPQNESTPQIFLLSPIEELLDEIVIEATRANRSVADLPTRTEVLSEEIDEAASMEPSKIAHLITHSTGIQVQTTAASSNGAVVRIQGLNGRYTQILKDGFPLYGGFSGSLDVMQIPPLDLKQVEYIKGSASTLYGGGAIAGLINLVTKKAVQDETLLHINLSHIGAKDFNTFVSRKFGKFGFTNLASLYMHSPYDADKDGYSDIPEVSKFNFNPKIFYNPSEKTEIYLGANIMKENRVGGSMRLINNGFADTSNFFLDKQESIRYTSQFSAKKTLSENSTITLKNSISSFDRHIRINENPFGQQSLFAGNQLNSFSELNYNLNKQKHNINTGLNTYTNSFTEKDLGAVQLRNQ
ncbi:MAG: TonB-dependent receptor, partial [Flavobacteriales bacterium]|nr:TonB-dependent receptor [Flavobacteriales bacterium]